MRYVDAVLSALRASFCCLRQLLQRVSREPGIFAGDQFIGIFAGFSVALGQPMVLVPIVDFWARR